MYIQPPKDAYQLWCDKNRDMCRKVIRYKLELKGKSPSFVRNYLNGLMGFIWKQQLRHEEKQVFFDKHARLRKRYEERIAKLKSGI